MEEAALRAQFGSEYDRYSSRVPRWIGPQSLSSA
jgi:protein-S-isoprenylcysteine O-methyltransferase Ste14